MTIRALTLILLATLPAAAQVDEQTEEALERERLYLEQQRQAAEEAKAPDPEEDPEALREAFLAEAERLVRDRNYWSRLGTHYRLQTDDPSLDSENALALLDSFWEFFDGFWGDAIELEPVDGISRVFCYDSFHKYNKLLPFDASRSGVRPRGHYISLFDALVVYSRADSPGGFADSLVHEAAHQAVSQRIYGGRDKPVWLSEGLAAYFGFTRRTKSGEFRRGEVGGKALPMFKSGTPSTPESSRATLQGFRRDLRSQLGEGSLSARIIGLDRPEEFYAQNVQFHYAASWLFVHFLLEGDDGAHRPAFERFLAANAAIGVPSGKLLDELGLEPAEIDAAFLRHARKVGVK